MWDFEYAYDKPGKRILPKKSYTAMDWSNRKEITAWEMAYCIYTFADITINKVPEERLPAVKKVLKKRNDKIQKEKTTKRKQKENKKKYNQKQEQIKSELAIYKHIDSGTVLGEQTNEVVGYFLDSCLFKTVAEASTAMSELMICNEHVTKKMLDDDFKYRDTTTYDRDKKRMLVAIRQIKQTYIKLGGKKENFIRAMKYLPIPKYTTPTLKEDLDLQREYIFTTFLSIGVEKTRAKKIAKAITTKAYDVLKDTV